MSGSRHGLQSIGRFERFGGAVLGAGFRPVAVSLDVYLPDMLGWTVFNHMKLDPTTRHIPVQVLTLDEDRSMVYRVERLLS